MSKKHLVVVVGGAVAGSEAVFQLRERGVEVVCIEQNPLPFGKIEDGLPRWHSKQRAQENAQITEKLDHPSVHFVPNTKIGQTLAFAEIHDQWKPSAILFASGAWRDRPVPVDGADTYIDKGLVYQNPLVYWFNHYCEPGYRGSRYEIPDGTMVIGGGLASLDVMKICQIELAQKALAKRGINVDMHTLETQGIPKTLEAQGLSWKDLNLKGTTLYYRRRAEDMPLAEADEKASPERKAGIGAVRKKILTNCQTKFCFEFSDRSLPCGLIVDNNRLVGLKFTRTEIVDGTVKTIPNSEFTVRAPLIISSIGSIPEPIPGVPWKGEKFEVKDIASGEVKGMPGVYLLGNAVTGKGNIRVSRMHAREVTQKILENYLTVGKNEIEEADRLRILKRAAELQKKAGYDGRFRDWAMHIVAQRQNPNNS